MKILMLTPYLPYPPASGGQIRTLYLLKYLAVNHDITLVSLYKHESEKQYAEYLSKYCRKIYLCKRAEKPWQLGIILKAIFSNLPFLVVRNYSLEAKSRIEKLLMTEKFDVIHAETFYIMPHIPKTDIPVMLVEQTIEYKVYQHYISSLPLIFRIPLWLDIYKLKYWEKFYWRKANTVATVSEADQQEIQKLVPHLISAIIPNGAGDEMFVSGFPKIETENPRLLFVGNFFWLQNLEAAQYLVKKIFPLILNEIPGAKIIIAGQNSSSKLSIVPTHNIEIIDLKPDDEKKVKELYHSTTLFLAPIFGPGGTRLKILASMASGLPVVSTKIGVEGLAVTHGTHVMIARTPEDFAQMTVELLTNKNKYESIQKNAYDLVKKQYSWKSIAAKLEQVYIGVTHQNI